MVNSFGPGHQKKPPKPANSKGVKKNINPVATNTPMGGTPAANPMGGASMDFDMPDMSGMQMNTPEMDFGMGDMGGMGGMQMNAPSPMGGGGYEDWMQNLYSAGAPEPTMADIPPVRSPEGPTTAGGWREELPGIAGMRSMGAQPTGMAGFAGAAPAGAQSPQGFGWDDPAMGGFQMDTPMMNDPMMGQPDMGGFQMDDPMMNDPMMGGMPMDDPMMGGMQMGQPDMGAPFMGDPVMGQQGQLQQGPPGQQPPPGLPPQGNPPDGWQGDFPANPIQSPFYDKKDEYYKMMMEATAPATNMQKGIYDEQVSILDDLVEDANKPRPQDKPPKPRPTIPGRSSFAGGQAPAGGDALGDAFRGPQAVSSVAPPVSQAPAILPPPVSEVAPAVSEAPVVEPTVSLPSTGGPSAYPPMVRDESGNMVTDPDYQSGKIKDYREMPVAPAVDDATDFSGFTDDPVAPTVSEVPSGFPARGSQASDDPSKMVNRGIWPVAPEAGSLRAPGQPMPEGFNPDGTPVAPAVSESDVRIWPADLPVSRPPTGQPDWKGDDTPEPVLSKDRDIIKNFIPTDDTPEPVLRDDRFISKSATMPPAGVKNWKGDDTPEPVKPPHKTGEFPHVGNLESRLVEKYYNEHGKMPVPFDDTPGGPQASLPVKPALEEFKDKVDAGEVSDDYDEEPAEKKPEQVTVNGKKYWKFSDMGKPGVPNSGMFAGSEYKGEVGIVAVDGKDAWGRQDEAAEKKPAVTPKEPVSEGAMQNAKNWDTVDGEYKFMGADYHKQNTRPETDTKDWEETREEAAEDIKEGDKFSEVGDAAYGTASSASRSAANEAELPRTGKIHTNRTTMESYNDLGERVDSITGQVIDAGAGGTAPIVSLPPTQPPPVEEPNADKEYYDKLVNPDKFQNPAVSLPPSYGIGEGPGSQGLSGAYHEYQGRKYDADPDELKDEYGNNLMGDQGIVSRLPGGVLGIRRRGESPSQMRIRRNNLVAQALQGMNQGLGATTGALPGMSSDIGSYAQQQLGPEVAARMAAAQAQIDIPFQYDMQHAEQVRQRRQEEHERGLAEAAMNRDDYYSYLNNLMQYGDTDNQITQWAAAQMPDQFG